MDAQIATVNQSTITSIVDVIEKMSKDSVQGIMNAGTKYGPEVLSTAENFIRLTAVVTTIQNIILFLVGIACFYIAKKISDIETTEEQSDDCSSVGTVLFCLAVLCGIAACGAAAMNILSMDNILSIISPKMELINMAKNAIVKN